MLDEESFQVERCKDATIVSLGSEFDLLEGDLVKKAEDKLLEVVEDKDCSHLILDMANTRFFGSSFIESLVRVWNQLKTREHGSLQLCCLQSYCKEILEVTHLDNIWEVSDSREDALKRCTSSKI
ncbi:MAG: STAS domain-containing protein [Planctomycetaceae bacterium]|nr:STAS domain-containing protein [Planctomycetaceae bacterium]